MTKCSPQLETLSLHDVNWDFKGPVKITTGEQMRGIIKARSTRLSHLCAITDGVISPHIREVSYHGDHMSQIKGNHRTESARY